ncbi:2-dehydropantoate 2-reductase [Pseudoduganella buxea]|uniref:2-dehydropantoate 2-reductase n=1 Tax=Pseudoduganella buxea TaxID=1949069 RepID=A0A6I3SYX1_9BURK|nr:2-dehydropantoate 2-reductase [Pseudoduganella buxea]MTV53756.1 2-dehydropantoate 2-reductase [Pseudoduganella buxea]GGC01699.1 2-dehydropantoate 2-reductase [Pseudoduganella buxea]
MKTCIVGAGAVGGFIGARLAASGIATSALARGATLAALREHGWRLHEAGQLVQAPVTASDDAADLGVQDLVVIAVKGPALGQVAPAIGPLLGPDTVVLPAMNGVPWWFAEGASPLPGGPLDSVDPGGAVGAAVPYRHLLGCVIHASTSTVAPGVVQHRMGNGLIVGEPDGGVSARARHVSEVLGGAGFAVTLSERIRYDIWYKLWGNMTTNPVTAITGATADRLLDDPLASAFCIAAMREAGLVGARIGCAIDETPEDRHGVTRKLGAFKTSMLQDVEAGRPIELDNIVGAVREIGQRVGVATPNIDALFGLTRLFARTRGLYPA